MTGRRHLVAALTLQGSLFACATAAVADGPRFDCYWDAGGSAYPLQIVVDLDDGSAARSDGGSSYDLSEATNRASWLMVDGGGSSSPAIQMIEGSATGGTGGGWSDVALHPAGEISAVSGGRCIER